MERDFMGLNSKEEAFEADGPEDLNKNRRLEENQKNIDTHGSAQLTIFYKGTVNVYNDMSPEKVQAIMLLAGNGARAQTHSATPRITVASHPMKTTLSTKVSVALDAPKLMSSLRPLMQSDVPQMREASLARFLQKRKERISSKPGSSSASGKDDQK